MCSPRLIPLAEPVQRLTAPTLQGDAAHPARTAGWLDTRLYFGLGPADHPEQGISEIKWRDFLDREVTPRFPDGLSVLDVYGQWLSKGQTVPERLHTKMLIIDYPDSAENRDKIDCHPRRLEEDDRRPVRLARHRAGRRLVLKAAVSLVTNASFSPQPWGSADASRPTDDSICGCSA